MIKTKNKLVKTENEKRHIKGGYVVPSEVADGICVAVLKEYRGYLKSELSEWKKNPKSESNPQGKWLHPEDVVNNMQTIDACNLIIKYFGAE
jgi:hypothetical protein